MTLKLINLGDIDKPAVETKKESELKKVLKAQVLKDLYKNNNLDSIDNVISDLLLSVLDVCRFSLTQHGIVYKPEDISSQLYFAMIDTYKEYDIDLEEQGDDIVEDEEE